MLCRRCVLAFKRQLRPTVLSWKNLSDQSTTKDEKDPADYFFNDNVQNLMKHLTRIDLGKVFQVKKDGQKIEVPEYKFMTSEQLENELSKMRLKAEHKLQMPPVVKVREEINCVLSDDPQLNGHDTSNYVFTDITFGVPDRDRIIVVREMDGVLRKANWSERDRMNQIYFERPGKKLTPPKMFEDAFLKDMLKRKEYAFTLDRACAQYEADDPDFIRVRKTVYDYINENREYDSLRSTRHFGPMAFYLAWNKNIDDLLINILNSDRLDEAVSLIELYHLLNPDVKSAETNKNDGDIEYVKVYAELDSAKRNDVEVALQNYAQRQFHNIELDAKEAEG